MANMELLLLSQSRLAMGIEGVMGKLGRCPSTKKHVVLFKMKAGMGGWVVDRWDGLRLAARWNGTNWSDFRWITGHVGYHYKTTAIQVFEDYKEFCHSSKLNWRLEGF